MKTKIDLVDQLIQLTNSYLMEKDSLVKLELKLEIIHTKEELKKLVGEEEFRKVIRALGEYVI